MRIQNIIDFKALAGRRREVNAVQDRDVLVERGRSDGQSDVEEIEAERCGEEGWKGGP